MIPQLGAFLVKEPDHKVIFSQLLTKDDGVLRQLLLDQGVSEIDASGMIQRIIFDVRFVIENGGDLAIDNVGTFTLGQNGSLQFDQFVPAPVEEEAVEEEVVEAEAVDHEQIESQSEHDIEEAEAEESIEEEEAPELRTPTPIFERSCKPFEPDPDLEGLNYGERKRSRVSRSSSSRGGVDMWLVIGIAAVVLALGAILYGFLRSSARENAAAPLAQAEQRY